MKMATDVDVAGMIAKTFKVVTPDGAEATFTANKAQLAFERNAGQRNIVMKSRQQGMTTWTVARHLLQCILNENHVSVSMARSVEEAEHISHMAARMLDSAGVHFIRSSLQLYMKNGSWFSPVSSQSDRYSIKSAINSLHVSELARWSERGASNLEEVRAMRSPDCEEVVESTPLQTGDPFYYEWEAAGQDGVVRHFFPWWMGDENKHVEDAIKSTLTDEECGLIVREGVTLKQITQRRAKQKRDPQAKLNWQYLEEVPWNKKGK